MRSPQAKKLVGGSESPARCTGHLVGEQEAKGQKTGNVLPRKRKVCVNSFWSLSGIEEQLEVTSKDQLVYP